MAVICPPFPANNLFRPELEHLTENPLNIISKFFEAGKIFGGNNFVELFDIRLKGDSHHVLVTYFGFYSLRKQSSLIFRNRDPFRNIFGMVNDYNEKGNLNLKSKKFSAIVTENPSFSTFIVNHSPYNDAGYKNDDTADKDHNGYKCHFIKCPDLSRTGIRSINR